MRRSNRKPRLTPSKSAANELFNLAADAKKLVGRLLPDGVDTALDEIRQIKTSIYRLPDELGYLRSEPRLVIHVILLIAERILATHIEKEKPESERSQYTYATKSS